MKLKLKKNGIVKNVSTGFSWKFLFFGMVYTLYRSDWKGILIQFVSLTLTLGFSFIVMPFTYNNNYIKRLIDEGYKPNDRESNIWLTVKMGYDLDYKI